MQQEVERRNTNVAITVFWLGRGVDASFNGPHLDQSAFAALVNTYRKDILSSDKHDVLECSGYSSAYSSHDGHGDSVDRKHFRDSSYDSFGSYGHSRESSLTEENMPAGADMRRYGSTSSLNRSGELRLSSNLEMSYDSHHQSTPDLSNAHTRTSSVDSYEDSHGNHSRQSSDSVDIPTRTLKSQRRVSQSDDPLKFIKLKPSNDLAKQAEEQIIMVQEVKQVRKTIEKGEEDWQSNLSSWKSRRRRVSAAALERVEGTDDLIRSEEEKMRTKTYDQIRQEREKRKSTGQLHFYPIEDEELTWSVKTPSMQSSTIIEEISKTEVIKTESEPKRAPMLSSKFRSKSMGSAYAKLDVTSEDDNDKNKSKTEKLIRTFDENHNAENAPIKNESARRLSNKFTDIMKSFESKDEENVTPTVYTKPSKTFQFSVDSKSDKFKDSRVLDTQTARSTLQTKKKSELVKPRNYVEKNIKIKQKPHNPKGFGITVVGGQDKKQPVVIEKVNIGSAADVCEVQVNDEIISINNRDIGIMTQAMVRKVIDDANKKGELELRVRRYTDADSEQDGGEDEEDDDAFQPSPSQNNSSESDGIKSSFEPSRTSSRVSETSTQEKPWSRSYQSPSRSTESPSNQEVSQRSRPSVENSASKTDFPTTHESSRFARPRHNFSAKTSDPEKSLETSPSTNDVITKTASRITERKETRTEITESPYVSRRRQQDNDFNSGKEENTSIMSELDREKQWIMQQMSAKDNEENNEEEEENEETPAEEEQITPQSRLTVESTYKRSFTSYENDKPVTQEPALQQTLPSYERVEEEKPTIRVHRSRHVQEETMIVREIPVNLSNRPEVNHISLPAHPEPNRNDDLSPSSGGFGPPEILRRWQRPRPRSEYSSSGSLNDENKRLSASIDSTASSPRYPEDDFTQNHLNGSKPQAVVGQPVMLEIRQEQPLRHNTSTQNYSTPVPTLIIDPRNKADNSNPSLPQYNFHLNITDKNSQDNDQMRYDLEVERERIRQEEKDRLEREKKQWEVEEQRRIQEKEAKLRAEEEKLEREKQKIEEMKASMEREKRELSKQLESDNRHNDQYNIHNTSDRSDNNHQFSTYAGSNSMPRSLDKAPSWRSSHQREEPHQRENISHDSVTNRSAKPFSRHQENKQSNDLHDNHVQQDSLSKEEIHGLNSAPKPKMRSSQDWIQTSDSGSKHSPRSESPNEHWLVEEAERRRKSGHSSNYQSGPIRPKSDNLSNRWQDDRYGQPPRSLSPQNTRSNEFRQFSANPQNKLNQTLPANFDMSSIKSKPQPPVPPKPSRSFNSNVSSPGSPSTRSSSNLSSPVSPSSPKSHAEQVVAVSGRQLCSNCNQELGFGAAMVIESLGLYYHVQCFRCCVCHSTLGNGSQGADVRVRVNKLHCRNCYSNDEAGLKFSKV